MRWHSFTILYLMLRSLIAADDPAGLSPLLEEWNTEVARNFKDRPIHPATIGLEFKEVLTLPVTQRLLAEKEHRSLIESQILRQIVERCKKSHRQTIYAEGHYAYLYCHLKGMSPDALLVIAGAHEEVIDFVIAAMFAQGELDRELWWKASWKPVRKKPE